MPTTPHHGYRISPAYAGRWKFERYDGRYGGADLWRVIDTCDDLHLAQDRLDVAEGRISEAEAGKRYIARRKNGLKQKPSQSMV